MYYPQRALKEDPNFGVQHYKTVAIDDPNDGHSTGNGPSMGHVYGSTCLEVWGVSGATHDTPIYGM